jgi:cation diffusion facilitator family transporter
MGTQRRTVLVAFAANAAAAGIKLAAFSLTGAPVLASEGLHSLADCGNEIALLAGHRHGSAASPERSLLGRSPARYLWAFVAAVVVFGGSAAGSFAEATYRLFHPEAPGHFTLIAAAVGAAMIVEGASFAAAASESLRVDRGKGWIRHVTANTDPDLPVLLVEDVADMAGLALAFAGSALAAVTGIAAFDAAASYLIGLLLAANAVFLARTMGRLLLGGAVEVELEQVVFHAVGSDRLSARGLRSARLGPDELLFVIEAAVDPTVAVRDVVAETNAARSRVRVAVPSARHVFFDYQVEETGPDDQGKPSHVKPRVELDRDGAPTLPPDLPGAS